VFYRRWWFLTFSRLLFLGNDVVEWVKKDEEKVEGSWN
jgi:hypothetical protein